MLKKIFQNIIKPGSTSEGVDDNPELVATQEEFLEFVNKPLEPDMTEHYISILMRNYRFYTKKIAPRSVQQQFQEKLNIVVRGIREFYIGENKRPSVELQRGQHLYSFLKHVSPSTAEEIQNDFISSVTTPIKNQINSITPLFADKTTKESIIDIKNDDRIKLLDSSFSDFDSFKQSKEFQLCKVYQNVFHIGNSAAVECDLIFPDDTSSLLFKNLTNLISHATLSFTNSMNDPISLLCIDSFVFYLLQETTNTNKHMPTIMKVISTLVHARTTQIITNIGRKKPNSLSFADYEQEIFKSVIPVGTLVNKIMTIHPTIQLAEEKQRLYEIFEYYCTTIMPQYDNKSYAETINKAFTLLKETEWVESVKLAIVDRSHQIGKIFLTKYTPSLSRVLFSDTSTIEQFEEEVKTKACFETVSLFSAISKTCVCATQGLFSIVNANEQMATESAIITISTFCGYLETLYQRIPELFSILGQYEHACDSLRKVATSP